MMNKTAYLNGLIKQKEIEIGMESHKNNLKHMKSINHNSPDINPISVNRNKGKYIKNRRDFQIDLQNQILTQKIQKIINSSRNSKYYSSNQKYSKSLNGYVKRVTQQKINQDNLKLLVRLQESKPTYQTKKYLEEFQHIKQVEKKMSVAQFYLTDSPTFRKRKLNTNRSFMSRRNSSFGQNSSLMGDKNEIVKENVTLNDGKLWQIKIYKDEKQIKITGQVLIDLDEKDRRSTELKLIKIPNIEANMFLRKYGNNKFNSFIKYLKVDQQDGSLMFIIPQSDSPKKLTNESEKQNIQKKLTNVELAPSIQKRAPPRQIFNTVQKKPIELDDQIKSKKQTQKSKQQQKINLPKIQSKKDTNQNKTIKNEVNQQKSIKKVQKGEQSQKVKTKKSSISSIKSNTKVIQQAKSKIQKVINVDNHKKSEKEEQIKIQDSKQEEENYEQEKFQQSNNSKPVQKVQHQNKKQESVKEHHSASRQKIEQIKSKKDSVKQQKMNQQVMQESNDKKIESQQKVDDKIEESGKIQDSNESRKEEHKPVQQVKKIHDQVEQKGQNPQLVK